MTFSIKSVLVSDEVAPKCIEILEQNGINVVKNTSLTKEELINEIKNHDALIVRSATKVDAAVLQAGSRLKVVGRAGTGVDNIDCDAATAAGVLVMNTPGGNTLSAAEHTCAMICAMTRHIAQGTESLRAGRWDRKQLMGSELFGKTLAIIGLGRIGREVATRMQAFGMKTIGYDPMTPASVSAEFNCQWLPLEEIWPLADYITVHVPLLPVTKHLLSAASIARCKRGVRIVNVARGGIVEEAALLAGLESGQVGGAALDVFVEEPPTQLALVRHPRCVSTPHLGASTVEAQVRVAEEIAAQLVELSAGRACVGAINGRLAAAALAPSCAPWVALGRALGRGMASVVSANEGHLELRVSTRPELHDAAGFLGAALTAGLLGAHTGTELNLISAAPAAAAVQLTVSSAHDADVVGLCARTAAASLAGELSADGAPLITQIDDDALLQGLRLADKQVLLYLCTPQLGAVFDALSKLGVVVEAYTGTLAGAHVYRLAAGTEKTINSQVESVVSGLAADVKLLVF